ncbi:MAG TPA: L-serine ammonia-lyase, iron-sulfur-dependent, subunit alpha [Acidobacteriota bacterium]|nr:L-serine ammonia-lyase, iron-sulfur-dependent, subunit alpha [Acidobacteriota bacterium]
MKAASILNDVLGPVMRGPSSSHTAGSFHIGRLLRSLAGDGPVSATFTFDPAGSYAATYRQQGVDLALAAGLMGWEITDKRFRRALELAPRSGLEIRFRVAPLEGADHPNTVRGTIRPKKGKTFEVVGKSVGGGSVEITAVDGRPVSLDGRSRTVLDVGGARRTVRPLFYVRRERPLFDSAAEAVAQARRRRVSLGRVALAHEAGLLGLSEREVIEEITRRLAIMSDSVSQGLAGRGLGMKLLRPTAGRIFRAEAAGRLPTGGLATRAAARAMAALHVSNSLGIVCAAPTGGSAGVIPGVMVTLAEEKGLAGDKAARALLAAGAVGLVVAARATFAAEVAGCQVEIGAAGAMAAAAVVEAAGGSAAQAFDAAAVSLQNTMGSVCDLVQGMCEIPCHTRNAVAASSAFICADLVLGGYVNPVPLDETVDASFASGRMLPPELRCTAKGGLAVAPSALALRRRR